MNESNDKERLFVARCSLVLFIAGLVVPFVIAGLVVAVSRLSPSDTERIAAILAVGFGLIAEVLAVICGIFGRRHLSGKIGMIGAAVIVVLVVLALGLFVGGLRGMISTIVVLMLALVGLSALVWGRGRGKPHL
jgi:4-amino-4-deoxy-L-arabinose transferase-like glycosyltransferase